MKKKKKEEKGIERIRSVEQDKDKLRPALTAFYGNLAPELVQQAADILRNMGMSDQIVNTMLNPETFANMALNDPRLTKEKIDQMGALIVEMQQDGSRFVKPALRAMVKGLPRIKGGGRPHVTNEKKKRQMIEEVLTLLRHVGPGIALERISVKYGISRRTMQRVWAEPKKIPKQS